MHFVDFKKNDKTLHSKNHSEQSSIYRGECYAIQSRALSHSFILKLKNQEKNANNLFLIAKSESCADQRGTKYCTKDCPLCTYR